MVSQLLRDPKAQVTLWTCPHRKQRINPKANQRLRKKIEAAFICRFRPRAIRRYLHAQRSHLSIAINNVCKFVSNQCVEGAALEKGNYHGQGFTGSGNMAPLTPYFYKNQLNAGHANNSMEAANAGFFAEMPRGSFQTPMTAQSGTGSSSFPVGHSASSYLEGSKTHPGKGSKGNWASYEVPAGTYLNRDDTSANILAIDYGRFNPDGRAGTSK